MPSIFERLGQQLELVRLEQRYTKRRNRRSTFVSEATYVDGEYVYNIPTPTGSSQTSASSKRSTFSFSSKGLESSRRVARPSGTDGRRGDVVVVEERVLTPVDDIKEAHVVGRERERRWSGIKGSWGRARTGSKRPEVVDIREVEYEDGVQRTERV